MAEDRAATRAMEAAARHDAAVQRLLSSRVEQGLPLHVEDPVVLRRIATLLWAGRSEAGS